MTTKDSSETTHATVVTDWPERYAKTARLALRPPPRRRAILEGLDAALVGHFWHRADRRVIRFGRFQRAGDRRGCRRSVESAQAGDRSVARLRSGCADLCAGVRTIAQAFALAGAVQRVRVIDKRYRTEVCHLH